MIQRALAEVEKPQRERKARTDFVKLNWPEEAELIEMAKTMSTHEIGELLGIKRDTVTKKLAMFGVKAVYIKTGQLSDEQVLEARELKHTTKISYVDLGKRYGVSSPCIRKAILGDTYKHVGRRYGK